MTQVVRFNRVRPATIFDEFERLFERPFSRPETTHWSIAIDVSETDEGYLVEASLPGIAVDDLEITLEDGVLTIEGEVETEEESEDVNYHVRERRYGKFGRSVRFPTMVNGDEVEANYKDGILSLNVPKAEEVKPRRIEIKTS